MNRGCRLNAPPSSIYIRYTALKPELNLCRKEAPRGSPRSLNLPRRAIENEFSTVREARGVNIRQFREQSRSISGFARQIRGPRYISRQRARTGTPPASSNSSDCYSSTATSRSPRYRGIPVDKSARGGKSPRIVVVAPPPRLVPERVIKNRRQRGYIKTGGPAERVVSGDDVLPRAPRCGRQLRDRDLIATSARPAAGEIQSELAAIRPTGEQARTSPARASTRRRRALI